MIRFFAENKAVVEEEVENHGGDGSEGEDAGGQDEFVGEGKVEGLADSKSKFVEWGEEAKKLGKAGTDRKSEEGVPDEESNNRMLSDMAFFPSDFRVSEVGDNGSDSS